MAPQFPVVQGKTPLGPEWTCMLPHEFSRRVEDGCLVLWNSGLTIWLDQYRNDQHQSIQERMSEWMNDSAPEAEGLEQGIDRFSYITQDENDEVVRLNGFVFNEGGHLLVEMSTDDPDFLKDARTIFKSIKASA